MRVAFHTLGCRLNQFETEGMRRRLVDDAAGVRVVDWTADADVYVINSCAVTARAEQKCRQLARGVRRRRPDSRVVIAGCYAQLEGAALAERVEVDAVLGNEEKRALASYLPALGRDEAVVDVGTYRRGQTMADEWIEGFGDHARATIKVQEGCDMRCTFCAIWRARGPSRSRPLRDVVEQARRLAAAGYEEIVLAGVHVGHYGRDLDPAVDLSDLIDMLLEVVPEPVRLRVSSIDPSEVDDRLIDRLVANPRVCRYLHLPLQSGSESVLRRMKRAYSAAAYADLVERIAARDPAFGFGADVIVGFPGETHAEFEETRALLERLPVTFYHVFPYSDRSRTAAERMSGKVIRSVAQERSLVLRRLGEAKRRAFLAAHVGRTCTGIVEDEGLETGRAELMLDDYTTVWTEPQPGRVRRTLELEIVELDDEGRLLARRTSRKAHEGNAAA